MNKILARSLLVIAGLTTCAWVWSADLPIIGANDNTHGSGTIADGVLNLSLVAEKGIWYPETEDNPGLEMHAFREESSPLQTPGPMLRIPEGTEIRVAIRNDIPGTTLEVHGFQSRPSNEESVLRVPYGEIVKVRFDAGTPGTYFYWATTDAPFERREGIDSQLSGAFIVDDAHAGPAADKVFVLGEWRDRDGGRTAYTINGLAWPHTPRIETKVGEISEWRWVNPSRGGHPLHLHGSFYDVVTKGTLLTDTEYGPADQRSVVTELVERGTTMKMRWMPEYEGNWLMHCHISGHVSAATRLAPHTDDYSGNHAEEGMSGMVIGIHAKPAPGLFTHEKTDERRITMQMQRVDGHYGKQPGFAIGFGDVPAVVPGPPLFVNRGETVNIELVNQLGEPTSVHWHGMELESYYDGVAGFSGMGRSITPSIEPGKSFNAIFTPPRAGTFIYHTHMDDIRQLQAGLYGAMIVSDPDAPFDPEIDKLLVIGLMGFTEPETIGINGDTDYEMTLEAGHTYCLRIMNITASNGGFNVTLTSPDQAITWRPVAEDGADLPELHRDSRLAFREDVSVGETIDFEWTPQTGLYWFEVRRGNGEWMAQARVVVQP
jgi:FtsP/CotA-like multicopper oxidase with cupredoxin domain